MKAAARPSLERMIALDRAVRAGDFPNARHIARRLEVHPRTVHRDIAFLRDRCGAPLEYEPVRHGYYYRDPTYRLTLGDLTEGELVALLLAERALQTYRATPYAAELARLLGKLAAFLPEHVTIDPGDLAGLPSFRVAAAAEVDPGLFAALARAAREGRRLRVRYRSASRGGEAERLIDPYELVSAHGAWYLIGRCHRHGDVRTFHAGRIGAAESTGERFDRPGDFRLDAYLADAFGIYRGADGERHRVRLLFTGEAARYVAERTWHPSQAAEPAADGGLILTFELSHLQEIARWALSWGCECLVLEPEELRARVAREASESAARYLHPADQRCKPLPDLHARSDSRRSKPTRGAK